MYVMQNLSPAAQRHRDFAILELAGCVPEAGRYARTESRHPYAIGACL